MEKRIVVSAMGFAAAMACGVYISLQAADVTQFVDLQNNSGSRIPAAIRHDLDFSGLQGAELMNASRKRLLTAARVILQDEQQGIELGHFVMRGQTGRSQLACDYYDQIQMKFAAEGIADSGEKPAMEIDGPCSAGQDITQIAPIWIPVSKILAEQPGNMDLTYEDGNVHFHFADMGAEWPTHWSLVSVRLFNSNESDREVTISHEELRQILNQPFVLNWQMSNGENATSATGTSSSSASSTTGGAAADSNDAAPATSHQ